MAKVASNRALYASMESSVGPEPGALCGISDLGSRRYSRYPTTRAVRYATEPGCPTEGEGTGDGNEPPGGQPPSAPVSSATLDGSYRGASYRVTAWQPQGKPAFVFLLAIGERKFLQPNIPEGADFEEVMRHAAHYVEQLLDEDEA
ncbi:hypothetical protein [Stenotrophomonas sp. VV52]|uniref:hypothetical protein n=1 Tax=Stenotrophomonas sp. VV52 TaxID=2066958 RepID=UPI000C9EBB75|nr:hypothetical protein [Stenotrophomonas sp. VV52]